MPVTVPVFPLELIETETEMICADHHGELWARLNASDRNRVRMEAVYKGLCLYFGQPIMSVEWHSTAEFG